MSEKLYIAGKIFEVEVVDLTTGSVLTRTTTDDLRAPYIKHLVENAFFASRVVDVIECSQIERTRYTSLQDFHNMENRK